MRDNKRIIEIDGIKYFIDRTFDNSPAIYKKSNKYNRSNKLHHINSTDKYEYLTNADSLINSIDNDCVIIIARKVIKENNGG